MEKIKLFLGSDSGRDILTVVIIILVGLGSFGLGRLSTRGQLEGLKIEYTRPDIELRAQVPQIPINSQNPQNDSKSAPEVTQESKEIIKTFFASRKGSKYYSASCSGGKTIKLENKIYFSSKEEAEGAGYELSSTCR